ncbi:n-alkane-inducible cytochrome P450 [Penicillium angulare]|uniref:n-alkane-inducible cytochrome P450 n=1 Tax=Penicillium angulare TaxID=116970 RepID=UPI00253FEC64|nr:n-alkane-inducible cytochrome P450 [Penicillium angulare]KAJ5291605.1 n-alkane-inducible cytochrome P450 [Penicillium angulare]
MANNLRGKKKKKGADLYFQDRIFARKNGCFETKTTMPSYFFGFDHLWKLLKAYGENESMEFAQRWHNEFGNTFNLPFGVGRTVVRTCDPKNVQAILATKFNDFEIAVRQKPFGPLLGNGIFVSDGKAWEHSRALLRPNFVRNQISDIAVYEKHVSQLIKHIPLDGSTVDLQDLFLRMTIDSATEFLFGQSTDTLGNGKSKTGNSSFAENFSISQAKSLTRLLLGPFVVFHRDSEFVKASEESRKYVRRIVEETLEQRALQAEKGSLEGESYVFLHELAKRTQDEKMLTDQLLNILLAGRDTTAALLSITFFTMAKREDVWSKLRTEVLKLEGRQPSFEDLKSMTYLQWVMNEILRLYPIVPFNIRVANKNTVLPTGGGPCGTLPIFIRKGQEVQYSVYTMQRLPEFFGADSNEFKPERWEKLRPGWAYLPFNGGPRVCIGQQFALTEAGYTIVRIVQQFERLESRTPEAFKGNVGLTLSSEYGAKVALTPIQA